QARAIARPAPLRYGRAVMTGITVTAGRGPGRVSASAFGSRSSPLWEGDAAFRFADGLRSVDISLRLYELLGSEPRLRWQARSLVSVGGKREDSHETSYSSSRRLRLRGLTACMRAGRKCRGGDGEGLSEWLRVQSDRSRSRGGESW